MLYLAAGSAAAAAAGTSWDALMKARILAPLGMAATRTSLLKAWKDPRVARGYTWDEARKRFQLVTLETLGNNIDGIAPAGAISATTLDMTSWIRFLLRQGVHDGKPLISPAALTTTWTPQIQVGGTVGYGMGWFVRTWQGQRLMVAVDAETGDVLQDRRTMSFAEAGAMPATTTYSDYRDVGGMRVPHRYVESNDQIGRTIYEVERVEVGVTLAPDIFTLQALTASGGGR